MLSHKQWSKINEAIQLLYTIKDINIMAESFLDSIHLLVPYDKAVFYIVDSNGLIKDKPILKNVNEIFFKRYFEIIERNGNSRIAINYRKTMAYRDSDYLEDRKENNEIYIKLLNPDKIVYGGGIVVANNQQFIAEITVYRYEESNDFSDEELEILDILKDHLQIRLTQNSVAIYDIKATLTKYDLTKREYEIIEYIISDCSNAIIANNLNISIHTVKKHIQNIYMKLGITNRMQLIKIVNNFLE